MWTGRARAFVACACSRLCRMCVLAPLSHVRARAFVACGLGVLAPLSPVAFVTCCSFAFVTCCSLLSASTATPDSPAPRTPPAPTTPHPHALQGKTYGYKDVCHLTWGGTCADSGPHRMWFSDLALFESSTNSDADVQAALASLTYPDRSQTFSNTALPPQIPPTRQRVPPTSWP